MGLVLFFVAAPVLLLLGYALVVEGIGPALAIFGVIVAFLLVTSMLGTSSGKGGRWRREYEARRKLFR